MAHWLLKTEPSEYSFDDLLRDKKTTWSGVTNPQALGHIRAMKKGDSAFIYHTGDEKQVVGIMEITSDPYADRKDKSLTVVDVRASSRLAKPVTLQQFKSDPAFADWELVRISRLSVMPVPPALWQNIIKMAV